MAPLAMLTLLLTGVPQSSTASDELAAAAKAVFATKCIQCHGPQVPYPKAAFGYITDLRRLVASGKYIVPRKPGESEIWKEISDGDMPPDEAKAGPLTQAESDSILAWIVAGAPLLREGERANPASDVPSRDARTGPMIAVGDRSEDPASGDAVPPADRKPLVQRAVELIGRAHVIVVHFPVALLISAGMTELWASLRGIRAPLSTVRFCVWVGAMSALAAGSLGWVHALDGFPGPSANPMTIAGLHRWLGTGAAVLAPIVALIVERDARLGRRTIAARIAILALAAIVGISAHFGGLLTHGPGFFDP